MGLNLGQGVDLPPHAISGSKLSSASRCTDAVALNNRDPSKVQSVRIHMLPPQIHPSEKKKHTWNKNDC